MDFKELQEIVSVCLDEIVQLKQQNTQLTEIVKTVAQTCQDNRTQQQIASLKTRIHELQSQVGYLRNREKIFASSQRRYIENPDLSEGTKEKVVPFEGRGVVYSAITGGYDDVKEVVCKNPSLDYILFTDNRSITSTTWKIRYLENPQKLDSVRLARRVKILGQEYLSEYDYSIWVDAKLEIIGDLRKFVERYRDTRSLLCFNHYSNDCVYDEERTCEGLNKDNVNTMRKQMERYRQEGYPEHNGMIDSAILVRDMQDEQLLKVMYTWWQEVLNNSYRDQLSFPYSCWKHHFLYDTTSLFIYLNDYVKIHGHN